MSHFVVQGRLACSRLKSGTQQHLKRLPGAGADLPLAADLLWRQREVNDGYRSRDTRQGRGRGREVDSAACMVIVCKQQAVCSPQYHSSHTEPPSQLTAIALAEPHPSSLHSPSAVPPSTALCEGVSSSVLQCQSLCPPSDLRLLQRRHAVRAAHPSACLVSLCCL